MNIKTKIVAIYLILILLIFTIIVSQGCTTGEEINNQDIVIDISVTQALELIQKNLNSEDFIILDVRTPSEFQQAHLENAINIDFQSEFFQTLLDELDKNKIYLVYCQSGNRSSQATNIMVSMDFNEVYNMLGGISAWIAAGYTVISGSGESKTGIQISNRYPRITAT